MVFFLALTVDLYVCVYIPNSVYVYPSLSRWVVWAVPWSCQPSRGLSPTRTVWRTTSAAWDTMSLITAWDPPSTTALCLATFMPILKDPLAGLGQYMSM